MNVEVYLEIASTGVCMAHVLDLPGCFSRGLSREAALKLLPEAARTYLSDLQRHGEAVDLPDEVSFQIVETSTSGGGPFHPGDPAALFSVEREPISREEMENRYLTRAAYNRADLLDLVNNLPDEIIDWQPDLDSMSIRRILRHIGNSEEWYLSRLVEPDALPSAWEGDEELPIFEFLEMERRTMLESLRGLDEDALGSVSAPAHFTDHPGELWSARKALRRLLEHEREHTAHIREVLAARRAQDRARLAAERSHLFEQLLGLSEKTLTTTPVFEDYTPKDLLAHLAYWDEVQSERIRLVIQGREAEISSVDALGGMDALNAESFAAHQGWTLDRVVEYLISSRERFLDLFVQLPNAQLFRERTLHGSWQTSVNEWVRWRGEHDAEHADDLRKWRQREEITGAPGPKSILLAWMQIAREEILSLVDLIPEDVRASRPVCGEWTLKDLLGHLTDWERVGIQGLHLALEGETDPNLDLEPDFDKWNAPHAEARKDQPWEKIWEDFTRTFQELVGLADQFEASDLTRPFKTIWSRTLYGWLLIWFTHEQEHAAEMRASLQLSGFPSRLVGAE